MTEIEASQYIIKNNGYCDGYEGRTIACSCCCLDSKTCGLSSYVKDREKRVLDAMKVWIPYYLSELYTKEESTNNPK